MIDDRRRKAPKEQFTREEAMMKEAVEDDEIFMTAKPPPPAPRNRGQIKFDFDGEEDDNGDQKFNSTLKENLFGKKKPMIIEEAPNED